MLASIYLLGFIVALFAPLLRRSKKADWALAAGALTVLLASIIGLLFFNDPKWGEAAVTSNRKEYLFFIICELPVFALALLATKGSRWAFWVGWGINAAVSVIVAIVVVQLMFFWHW
jgi:hypothetical protein